MWFSPGGVVPWYRPPSRGGAFSNPGGVMPGPQENSDACVSSSSMSNGRGRSDISQSFLLGDVGDVVLAG